CACGQCGLGLLELELAREQCRLALGELSILRLEHAGVLLDLGLAPREQLLGVRVVLVDEGRLFGPAKAKRAFGRLLLVEVARPPLDLELPARDVGGALAERALQILELDEVLAALSFALRRQPARELQHLLAARLAVLPAGVLPGVFGPLHAQRLAPGERNAA